MTQDVTNLVVPLWPALVAGGGILATLLGVVAWVFSTFERKEDAQTKHDDLDRRVLEQEKLLQSMAQDVSYIRGRLEPK
jgi:hypothetical protein